MSLSVRTWIARMWLQGSMWRVAHVTLQQSTGTEHRGLDWTERAIYSRRSLWQLWALRRVQSSLMIFTHTERVLLRLLVHLSLSLWIAPCLTSIKRIVMATRSTCRITRLLRLSSSQEAVLATNWRLPSTTMQPKHLRLRLMRIAGAGRYQAKTARRTV